MNIILINRQIKELLAGLDYATLPNYPNISGFIGQSTIAFIVGSAKYADGDYADLELRISIATEKRTEDPTSEAQDLSQPLVLDREDEQNLEELIGFIVSKFHKRPLKGTKPITFKSFEISPPQSGKWRALVLFSILQAIDSGYEQELDSADPLTKVIDRRYVI